MLSQTNKPQRSLGRHVAWLGMAAVVICALPTLYLASAAAQESGGGTDAASDPRRVEERLERLEKEQQALREILRPKENETDGAVRCYAISKQEAEATLAMLNAFGGTGEWRYSDTQLLWSFGKKWVGIAATEKTHARIEQLIRLMQNEASVMGETDLDSRALRCWLGETPSWERVGSPQGE